MLIKQTYFGSNSAVTSKKTKGEKHATTIWKKVHLQFIKLVN